MGQSINRMRYATINNNRAIGSSSTECPICGHLFSSTDTYGNVRINN